MIILPKNRNIHRPPHIYLSDNYYFITARTINKTNYFNTDKKKEVLVSCLKEICRKCEFSLLAWVILSNHYHFQGKVNNKNSFVKMAKLFHGKGAFILNKFDNKPKRKIWYQYREKILRNKKDFWMHFNYIHNNPIKHGFIKDFEKLKNYKFSSFNFYLRKFGKEWLLSSFEKYPIIDFTEE